MVLEAPEVVARIRVFRVDERLDFLDVNRATFDERAARDRSATNRHEIERLGTFSNCAVGPMPRQRSQTAGLRHPYGTEICRTQQPCPSRDRIEHRLNVGRRTAYHLQDLGRRRLALEQGTRLIEQPRVLERDAHAGSDRTEQADVRVAVGVLAHMVVEDDDPQHALAALDRYAECRDRGVGARHRPETHRLELRARAAHDRFARLQQSLPHPTL